MQCSEALLRLNNLTSRDSHYNGLNLCLVRHRKAMPLRQSSTTQGRHWPAADINQIRNLFEEFSILIKVLKSVLLSEERLQGLPKKR